MITQTNYYGYPSERFGNEHLQVEYLLDAGPRIVGLRLGGSETNLLGEFPHTIIDTPDGGYRLLGGHRIWIAPEIFPETYTRDDHAVTVEAVTGGMRISGAVDAVGSTRKVLELVLHDDAPGVTLTHIIENLGDRPLWMAPWAITIFPLGGVVYLPQNRDAVLGSRLLPNRNIVLWPYASWTDARLVIQDEAIRLTAASALPPLKVGTYNAEGWMGYARNDLLFIKKFQPEGTGERVDLGCNCECYMNDNLVELETLGNLAAVPPGGQVVHREVWEIYDMARGAVSLETIQDLVTGYGDNHG